MAGPYGSHAIGRENKIDKSGNDSPAVIGFENQCQDAMTRIGLISWLKVIDG
ncbi:hypothetical protein [Desulfosarcina variabilis]|mgnify:CR=1 FL=1|uniref:hypothetical protein n=1 Tax=Desulfosarcina variabilis TaxID=2300 RepID=UPI003AFB6824